MKISSIFTSISLLTSAYTISGEVYFKEQFNDDSWKEKWTVPTYWKPSEEMGEWKLTTGRYYGIKDDTGLQTTQDARFYGLSAKLQKEFISDDKKDLVIQYSVKNEHKMDCGGAYLKLLPGGDKFDVSKFGGETPYAVMFGPDICGSTKRTHTILHYAKKDSNLLINKDIPVQNDKVTHLYTLVIRPDNTFEVFTDNMSVRKGNLDDEFDFLEPKEIKDPSITKPKDWVDQKKIPDPNDQKPDGYDDTPEEIPDPDARKPDDWDDEDDGEWEAPMIDNPAYEGPWSPKMIDNPDYKGTWEHPMIPNPDYTYDKSMYAVCANGCTHIGFELWQVKSGTIFDDIIVSDSLREAQEFAKATYFKKKDGEKKMEKRASEEERKVAESTTSEENDINELNDIGNEF